MLKKNKGQKSRLLWSLLICTYLKHYQWNRFLDQKCQWAATCHLSGGVHPLGPSSSRAGDYNNLSAPGTRGWRPDRRMGTEHKCLRLLKDSAEVSCPPPLSLWTAAVSPQHPKFRNKPNQHHQCDHDSFHIRQSFAGCSGNLAATYYTAFRESHDSNSEQYTLKWTLGIQAGN